MVLEKNVSTQSGSNQTEPNKTVWFVITVYVFSVPRLSFYMN